MRAIDYAEAKIARLKLELDAEVNKKNPWLDRVLTLHDELQAPGWLIDGFLTDKMTIIAGAPGVGKTSALVPLALLAAGFQSHLSNVTCKHARHVIYVTEDAHQVETMLYGVRKHMHNMVTDKKVTYAEMNDRFHLVATKKSKPEELSLLVDLCKKYTTTIETAAGTFELMPLLILDTASSTFDLEDENKNSEVSRYIATLKETFLSIGIPIWIVAHTAKTMKRADVKEFSARGAGAFEGDANCIAYLFQEDGLDERFLMLGKHRYVAHFTELKFDSCVHQESVVNKYGEDEVIPYRYTSIDRSTEESRIAAKMEAKDQAESDQDDKNRKRIFEAVVNVQNPTKSNVARYKGKLANNLKLIEQMLEDGELRLEKVSTSAANGKAVFHLRLGN
jgi:RecA-family ATPase